MTDDYENYQREIFQTFHKISLTRSEAEDKANLNFRIGSKEGDDFVDGVIQYVEDQTKEQGKKTNELSHISNAKVLLTIAIAVYLLILFSIFIPWQYAIIISQIISYIALSRAESVWDMDKAFPVNEDRWSNFLILIIPFLPLLVALYFLLICYPKGLKAINEKYPEAIEEEEAVSLIREADQEYNNLSSQVEISHQSNQVETSSNYYNSLNELNVAIDIIKSESGIIGASWDDELWGDWTPVEEASVPFIRIGNISEEGKWDCLSMPAFLKVIGGSNLLIKASGDEGKEAGVGLVRSIMLRLLAFTPPGRLQFILIHPMSSRDLADFLCLKEHDETLTGKYVWTEPSDIEKQLVGINEKMESITQTILNKYSTIEEYNSNAGVMAEPYRILIIINYPINFTDTSARYLNSIFRNGLRCGIYTVLTADTDKLRTKGGEYY